MDTSLSPYKATILTVDDNDVLRYSLGRMLLDAGFRVIEARNGGQALELAATLPDLITLDVNLPDMDGFKVCKHLKSDPATRHIPVLHVSSTFTDPESRILGLKGGADAYLAEPIDRGEFVATVEALLRSKRSENEARRHAELAETSNLVLEERVKQRTVEIERKTAEIQNLTVQLMKLQDEERRRIARELHDSTGQYLTLLNMNLSKLSKMNKLDSLSAKALISDSASITTDLTSHLRTVSYLLHPPLLDEMGLISALQWYVEGFTQRSRISVSLKTSEEFGRLAQDLEIAIFRIIQECLTNVHRHSGGQSASVQLDRQSETIILNVSDSGKKFETGAVMVSPGTGILGMRERVRQLNGHLDVSFGPTGTRITAVIPNVAAREEID